MAMAVVKSAAIKHDVVTYTFIPITLLLRLTGLRPDQDGCLLW